MKLSSSLKLALIFFVFAVIYIIISDKIVLQQAGDDRNAYNRMQTYKGIGFVVLASILIYLVSSRMNRHLLKAQKEQEESLRRYNVLGMATNDAIWDLNLVTGECFTNRTLQEMFGYTADELADNNTWWTINLHPDDKQRVVQSIDAKLKGGGTVWQDEYRFRCKDGSYKRIFDRGYILRDKSGMPYRLIGAMQDVTDQRRLQQQLLEEQLRHKNEVAKSVINAQEAERKKLGEELHDNITQLLSVIKLYIENAKGEPENQDELLNKSSEYLLQVIDEIRALSRSLVPPMIRDISLIDAIQEMAKHVQEASKIKINIDAKNFNEGILTESRKLLLYRVVQEKLSNVINHAGATEISIRLRSAGKHIETIIKDNGKGFDPSNTKAGMGLSNIRNRVESVNGRMNLQSTPGEGCVLTVQFEA
jgi:two-component system, NarL family, sensor histidine kinase UhpB